MKIRLQPRPSPYPQAENFTELQQETKLAIDLKIKELAAKDIQLTEKERIIQEQGRQLVEKEQFLLWQDSLLKKRTIKHWFDRSLSYFAPRRK